MAKDLAVSPSEVFITGELERRDAQEADYLKEKKALQELASRMADRPKEVLPKFVDLAMQLTGGSSAGLSLYEANPYPGIFRWHHVCGSLARFDGATTPRNHSPCGVTLDQRRTVLTRHSERMYDWISDAGIVLPEVLLVPLYFGVGEPLGTVWIVSDKEGHFNQGHVRIAEELATFVSMALHMQRTEDRLRQALERQEMLTREMNHRVKNLFAIANAMIRFGARHARDKEDMAATLSGRLQTLADAHTLILPSTGGLDGSFVGRRLEDIVLQVLHAHESPGIAISQFTLDGPAIICQPNAVSPIALVFNELATNAIKYGALMTESGRVLIDWRVEAEQLIMTWREHGGTPIAAPPSRQGFGTRLLDSTIIGQFNGHYAFDWQPDGLIVTIEIPTATLSA